VIPALLSAQAIGVGDFRERRTGMLAKRAGIACGGQTTEPADSGEPH
jgi:hypothetical protein